jgi:diacylglycerol kinase (ATP)
MKATETWVLLNEAARHHRARSLWGRVEPTLSQISWLSTTTLDSAGHWRVSLAQALERGCRHFVAAGGDGTVGSLFDALYQLRGSQGFGDITVGAVGLGSSNDFHKPYSDFFAEVPVRIDPARTTRRDLGLVTYLDCDNVDRHRCFAVSASVGVVAKANALFNCPRGLTRLLKSHSPSLAMVAAALQAVATAENQELRLRTADFERQLPIMNLSIAKTRYLAGSLAYEPLVHPCDGQLAINLCEDMSRWELLRTLIALYRGHFRNRPKTLTACAAEVSIESVYPFDLELDGETFSTRRAILRTLPHQVRVCS